MKKIILISLLSVFVVAFVACSSSVEEKSVTSTEPVEAEQATQATVSEPDSVYTEVDKMPVFTGGDKELLKYILENVVYPEAAKKAGTEGKSFVRFCVKEDGTVDKVSVLKGVSPEIDAEAVRVISNLPAFESPGYKDGEAVSVWYVVPIHFKLN